MKQHLKPDQADMGLKLESDDFMKLKPGQVISKFTTKKGHYALIRVVKRSDLAALFEFANDLVREDTFVMLSGAPLTYSEEQKYLSESLRKIKTGKKIQIIAEIEGKLAGSAEVRLGDRRKSHVGEVGISISKDFREEGIGEYCMHTLIDCATKAGLKLLFLHTFENNARALHLYEKVGFKKAGIVPGMYQYRNLYIGEVTMYLPLN